MANSDDYAAQVEARINAKSAEIEGRLDRALDTSGKIDMRRLEDADPDLFNVLDMYALSKTWRDDPKITARDVAKLLEARADHTRLAAALKKLGSS